MCVILARVLWGFMFDKYGSLFDVKDALIDGVNWISWVTCEGWKAFLISGTYKRRVAGLRKVLLINARYLLDLFWYCLEIAKYLDTSVLYWAWYWIWKIWVLILVLLLSLDLLGIDIDIGIPFQILRYWNWYWYWIQKLLVLAPALCIDESIVKFLIIKSRWYS